MRTIRLIETGERRALASLLEELLGHYGMAPHDRASIESALDAQPAGVEVLVAFDDGAPVGFASFAQLFPGQGIAPQIYMKDLYVASAKRSTRVGEALMRELARLASARGCTRLDWTTERTNERAQAFYRAIGARVVEQKVFFRLDADGIAALSRQP
jgi:ribosomal protein S18 acetylase RimI-like enzyme